MNPDRLLIGVLAFVLGLATGWVAGWLMGRREEREIARMLDRQKRGFDPYESANPPTIRQDRLA